MSRTVTVPLYIAALSLYCHSAARPIRARANIIYILYRDYYSNPSDKNVGC